MREVLIYGGLQLPLVNPVLDSHVFLQRVLVLVGGLADAAHGRPVEGGVRVGVMPPGVGVKGKIALADCTLATTLGGLENPFETCKITSSSFSTVFSCDKYSFFRT